MDEVPFRAGINLEYLGPTLDADGSVVITGTCTGRLFDETRENRVGVNVSSGLILTLDKPPKFKALEDAYIALDDGTFLTSIITAVDHKLRTITITDAIPSLTTRGSRVERQIGPNIAMPSFNTGNASASTIDWGWRGVILATHADIVFDMVCRAERTLVDGSGNVLIANQWLRFTDV